MAPRTPRPLRTLASLLRAVLGLIVLLALVGGVPLGLLAVGHQPGELTGGWDLLTRQDDGTLFLVALTLIGWVAWALFALSVLVELGAVLRRRSAPRLKGLGGMQSLASTLIGAIVLLAPTAASAATATPATAVTHSAPQSTTPAQDTATPPAAAPSAERLQHKVTSLTETPWDLAEKYLGNGQRWKDIAALNPAIPELASGDQYLPQGATIVLPANARPVAPARSKADNTSATPAPKAPKEKAPETKPEQNAAATDAQARPAHVTVSPGDSLWKIADKYGDGTDWTAIYEANKGEDQGNGHTFTNPNLIYPGQELNLPADTAPPPAGSEAGPQTGTKKPTDRAETPAPKPKPTEHGETPAASGGPATGAGHEQGAGGTAKQPESGRPAPSSTAPTPAPSQDAQRPETDRPSQPTATPATDAPPVTADTGSDNGQSAGVVGLAASGALAAALVGTLATRRLLQRRRLRRGRKIVMPQGRPAATEVLLRSVDASHELHLLDAMLRALAVHLAEEEGRVLPALAAVRLGEQGALLHLTETAEPVAPFTAHDEAGLQWWCPTDSDQLLGEEALREVDPPYPALVPLGDDTKGGIVLVDLEQVGVLRLVGGMRQQILRTLAIALALSPLGGQIELAVAGEDTAPGLTLLDPERVLAHDDLPGALRALRAHQAEQQDVLARCADGDLAAARLDGDIDELWPMVLLTDLGTCPGAEAAEELTEVAGRNPRTALAVLTSAGTVPAEGDDGWVVDTDAAGVMVPGTDVYCVLSACTDEEYADVIDLVLVTGLGDEEDDAPSPALQAAVVTPRPPACSSPGEAPEEQTPVPLPPVPTGSSPLAALADLDDLEEEEGEGDEPAGPGRNAPHRDAADAGHHGDEPPAPGTAPASTAAPVTPVAASSPSQIVLPAVAPAARVNARIHSVPAAVPVPDLPALPDGPYVQVLGPVVLDGAQGSITTNRRTTALEFIAWLALHPGAGRHEIDELLSPGGRVSNDTRSSRTTDIRRWLGTSPDGNPYLPHLNAQPDRLLRLDGVACDWHLFEQYADDGHQDSTPDGTRLLHQALSLVRGRPFAGVPPRRYQWAEAATQDMIKRIVHVAEDLADRSLHDGDGRGALWAATRGLDIAREAEVLWRAKFRALALLGHHIELEQAARSLEAFLLELGCSMDEETIEILQQLQASHH